MAPRYQVPAVKRAFEIIELLATRDPGASISEIRRELQLPLSSVAAIVYTLTDLGFLERDELTSRYRLSVKMFGIARRALDRIDLVAQCRTLIEEMVRTSKLTGHLAVLRGTESMYLDRIQSDGLVQFQSFVGMRWPAYTSAVGKALLAFQPKAELKRLLQGITLTRVTPYTITSKRNLERQLGEIRRRGYSWELNEGEVGVGCVAAPILDHRRQVVAAVSLTGTTHQITRAKIPHLGSFVHGYAQRISARLGSPA
jgi:IclR family transcriptional regulator, KDG regulon repressor